VGYSSLGPEVIIAAPAGNCVNTSGACLFSLTTTYDVGRTTPGGPGYTSQFNTNLGTSFSAPLVAGVGALMHAVNAKLAPAHTIARLKGSAHTFPDGGATPPPTCHVPIDANDLQQAECVCTTDTCGAGMLNAPGALAAALRPIAHIIPPGTISVGGTVSLDGSASSAACNHSIASYLWSVVATQNTSTPVLINANQATAQVVAPATGSFTLRLTVTDDLGAIDSGDAVITGSSASASTTAPLAGPACPATVSVPQEPAPSSQPSLMPQQGSSGGGGNLGTEELLVLMALRLSRLRLSRLRMARLRLSRL
jgi:serine protease